MNSLPIEDIGDPIKKNQSNLLVIDEIVNAIGFGKYQWYLLWMCAVGYMAVCSELLVIVFLQSDLMDYFNFDSNITYSWLPCLSTLSSLCSSLVFGVLSDRYGRKMFYIGSLVLVILGALLSICAQTFTEFVIFRGVIGGIGLGGLSTIDYVLFLECTGSKHKRGFYCLLITLCGTMGVLYITSVGWYLSGSGQSSNERWRWLSFWSVVPCFFCLLFRIYHRFESLSYLVCSQQWEQAYEVISQMIRFNFSQRQNPSQVLLPVVPSKQLYTYIYICIYMIISKQRERERRKKKK
ncbi:sugar transporter [Reticulomyxa filosa]|uniref:Sugar transporter n=1 Tax=Reticulomyxa filosa TaxID=46433 RepID=X6M6E8_RETFI|nr:sugar transporter [Reticulomyxa filosa]|eukprot:ETO08605.1 sugar transporter [Reticulomyxa filosa]